MKDLKFEKLVERENFVGFSDNGDWEYMRFGFGVLEGKSYYREVEGCECDEDVYELKKGREDVIKEGEEKGYFYKYSGMWYFEWEKEVEIEEWINSLKK